MHISILGTAGAQPTRDRNLPSFALRLDSGELLLFDAGEDVQRRFEAAKLKFNIPTTIFISHMHGDHIIGLPGLLFNFHLNNRTAPLSIIGPQGIASYLIAQFQTIGLRANTYLLDVSEITYPKKDTSSDELNIIRYTNFLTEKYERKFYTVLDNIIQRSSTYKIKAMWVNHSVPTLGFRFEENQLNGKFNPERALELKITRGNLWKQMQEGKTIITKDGREIDPVKLGIVSEKRSGYIIAYRGDTTTCPNLIKIAENADYFICEATYSIEDEKLAIEKYHMSTQMAANVAKESHVKNLILTHFSGRYTDVLKLEQEANEIFPNSKAAVDLMRIELKPK